MADFFSTADSSVSTTGELIQIGHVGNIAGNVEVTRPDGSVSTLSAGDFIYEGDVVSTDGAGVLGVVLADGSVISMSANSIITFDDFLYNQETQDGNLALEAVQGVFTFVSGQISKADPDAMVINTPTATIGIRGTQGGVNVDGQSGATDVVLMRESDGQVGEITVQTNAGAVVLNKEASGTTALQSNQPPTTPADVPLNTMLQTYKQSLQAMPEVGTVNRYDANTENTGSTTEESTDSEAGEAETEEAGVQASVAGDSEAEEGVGQTTSAEETIETINEQNITEKTEVSVVSGGGYTWATSSLVGSGGDDVIVLGDLPQDHTDAFITHKVSSGAGDDVIDARNAKGAVVIEAMAGNDTVQGTEKDDKIWGGVGADTLYGNGGNDEIYSNQLHLGKADVDSDTLYGGDGDDQLFADASGGDVLYGGRGSDTLTGEAGNDTLHASDPDADTDTVSDGSGDLLYGHGGDDTLHAGKWGGGQLFGGEGNDTLHGNDGRDTLSGGAGDDQIHGGAGNDMIRGGAGDDTLDGGTSGSDPTNGLHIDGGEGSDDIIFRDQAGITEYSTFVVGRVDNGKRPDDINYPNLNIGPKDTGTTDTVKIYLNNDANTKLRLDVHNNKGAHEHEDVTLKTDGTASHTGGTVARHANNGGELKISILENGSSTNASSVTTIHGDWDSYSISDKQNDGGGEYVLLSFVNGNG